MKNPAQDGVAVAEAATVSSEPKNASSKIYDANARNRFEYEVNHNGQKYDIAPVFGPLEDERYMQWVRDLKVKGSQGGDATDESREATVALWDDVILEVENVEYPEGAEWKSLIDSGTKLESMNDLLAVAIVEPEETVKSKLVLGKVDATHTVITEAWFNGEPVQQEHILKTKSFELEKKYERIMSKRIREEKTRGLHRRKAQIEYVPQDEKIGELYDEMCVSVSGFISSPTETTLGFGKAVPLRFKTLVINYIFAPKLDAKNLGK